MRTLATKQTAINQYNGFGNQLWDIAGARPSLDLQFADRKDLVDATTGSNLIDFTRASAGTYRGSDGLIKTAVTNLLLRSEEFDQSPWTASTGVTVTANAEIAPDGTLTAARVQWDAAGKSLSQAITVTSGLIYQFSVWVKGAAGESIRLSGPTGENYTLTGDWQRISLINTPSSSSQGYSLNTFGSATARDLYVWGAQLEQSSTVGEYVPTTSTINSAPRFDHDPVTGESLGLLVEESRTNLALNSENLSTANWDVNGSATIASGFTSPRGDSSAYLVENATSLVDAIGNDNLRKNNNTDTSLGSLPAGTYTVSGYVKANGATTIFYPRTRLVNSGVNSDGGINISTNWQRFTRTVTATVTDSLRLIFAADSIDGFYLWGLQVEAGSLPTSYIPTTSSTVTRAADVATDTSIGASIRTLYAEFRSPGLGTQPIVSLDDDTANERIELLTSGTDPKLLVTDGGSAVADIDAGTVTANTLAKLAARFATDDYAAAVDGGTLQTDTSGTLPTVDRIRIGSNQAGDYFTGTIARITGWDEELPDTAVEGITQ